MYYLNTSVEELLIFAWLQNVTLLRGRKKCMLCQICAQLCVWLWHSSKMDSQEDQGGGSHQGSGEPGLLPAQDAVPGQDHLTPTLQLLLQLGRFLSLHTKLYNQVTSLLIYAISASFDGELCLYCSWRLGIIIDSAHQSDSLLIPDQFSM